jgi:hypothetical protein
LRQNSDDVFVAGIAKNWGVLTNLEIAPLPQLPTHVMDFVRQQFFGKAYKPGFRQLMLTVVARSIATQNYYENGREQLQEFSDLPSGSEKQILSYLGAIRSFEASLLNCQLAILCLNKFFEELGRAKIFVHYDKSVSDKIREMCNRIKHFDEDCEKVPMDSNSPLAPLWITNERLFTSAADISFEELRSEIIELHERVKSELMAI